MMVLLGNAQAYGYVGSGESNSSLGSGGAHSISIWTNSPSFNGTQTVSLVGVISPIPTRGTNVTISVTSPGGVVVIKRSESVASTGSFSTSFESGQDASWLSGSYAVAADYDGSSGTTSFSWTPASFSIFWITDTQFLSESANGLFANTTKWIANNWNTYDGKMVIDTGDIVEDPGAAVEWSNANAAMSVLLDDGIPYTWDAGNHDILNSSAPNWLGSEYTAFNPSVVSKEVDATGYSGWVSSLDNGMDTAVTYTMDGMKFLVVNIEFDGNSTVLAWANALLSNPLYENDHVIVATHAYIYPDGDINYTQWGPILQHFTTALTAMIDEHPNAFLTMNGHFDTNSGFHQLDPTGTKYELVFNRQDEVDSAVCPPDSTAAPDCLKDGAATVTILTFEPQDNRIAVRTYAVDVGEWLTNSWQQFMLGPIFPGFAPTNVAFADSVIFATNSATYGTLGGSMGVTISATNAWSSPQNIFVFARFVSGTNIYLAEGSTTLTPGETAPVFLGDLQKIPAGTYSVTFIAVTLKDFPVSEPTYPVTITT
jgi:hypothetical protein